MWVHDFKMCVWGGGSLWVWVRVWVWVCVWFVMGNGRFEDLKERLRESRAQVCVGASA